MGIQLRLRAFAPSPACLILLLTTGCVSHVRIVQNTYPPTKAINTSLEDLNEKLNTAYDAIQSLTISANFVVGTGGNSTGKVTEYTPFKGYILLRKPRDLRVILLVPIIGGN